MMQAPLVEDTIRNQDYKILELRISLSLLYNAFLSRHGSFPLERNDPRADLWCDAMALARDILEVAPGKDLTLDMYAVGAAAELKVPIDQVTPEQRRVFKAKAFARAYGADEEKV